MSVRTVRVRGLRTGFWLGVSLAVGAALTFAVLAGARSDGSSPIRSTRAYAAHGTHQVVADSRPLAETLAVFSRPRGAGDVLPPAAAEDLAWLRDQDQVSPELRPGLPVLSRSRLLLADVGSRHGAIYVVPTTTGNVCFLVTLGPQGCSTGFTQASPVDVTIFDGDGFGYGKPAAVTGLVPDDVTGVTVFVDGSGHAARIASNAYFYELPDDAVRSPESLLISYRDGKTLTMPLPALRYG